MPQWPQLQKAPITEAIIDLRVVLPDTVTLDDLGEMHQSIQEDYPKRTLRSAWQASLHIGGDSSRPVAKTSGGPDGYLFQSDTDRQVCQARLDGFSLSRLHPYHSWGDLLSEAKQLWRKYVAVAKPTSVTRIAVRYVNRIELPLPSKFEDYFKTTPAIAPSLPQSVTGLLMRLQIPFDSPPAIAIVTQALQPNADEKAPYIFDIDVFRGAQSQSNSDDIWNSLHELRQVKNRVFFESLTELCIGMFE